MTPVITFRSAATALTQDVIVVGDHTLTLSATADSHAISHNGTDFNLTDAGRDEYVRKLQEIAKYGVVEING